MAEDVEEFLESSTAPNNRRAPPSFTDDEDDVRVPPSFTDDEDGEDSSSEEGTQYAAPMIDLPPLPLP